MEADGGGVILVAIEGGRIDVRLKGMCLDCPSAPLTMKFGIERTLKQRLPWVEEVRRIDSPCQRRQDTDQNRDTNIARYGAYYDSEGGRLLRC